MIETADWVAEFVVSTFATGVEADFLRKTRRLGLRGVTNTIRLTPRDGSVTMLSYDGRKCL